MRNLLLLCLLFVPIAAWGYRGTLSGLKPELMIQAPKLIEDRIHTSTQPLQRIKAKPKLKKAQPPIRIQLKSWVEIDEDVLEATSIKLIKIAHIKTQRERDYQLLSEFEVVQFPAGRIRVVVERDVIYQKIRQLQLTEGGIQFESPERIILVKTNSAIKNALNLFLTKDLGEKFQVKADQIKVRIERVHQHVPLKRLGEPGTQIQIENASQKHGMGGQYLFRIKNIDSRGSLQEQTFVTARALIQARSAVSKKMIRIGERAHSKNIQFLWKNLPMVGSPVFSLLELKGYRFRNSVNRGSLVLKSHLEVIPLAEVGDAIMLELRAGGVRVRTQGILLERAFKGKNVRVKNLTTQKILIGKVNPLGIVEVTL